MEEYIVDSGVLAIDKQMLYIENRLIKITKIDSLETVTLTRHPITAGLGWWFRGLIFLIIIYIIWHNKIITLIGDIYVYSVVVLLIYNLYQFSKLFYGLIITTAGSRTIIKSRNKKFIFDILDTINESINSADVQYTINLDNCVINYMSNNCGNDDLKETKIEMINIINNGIYSKGNNNVNIINGDIDFDQIISELKTLEKNCDEDVSALVEACKEKKFDKLLKGLRTLKKETIDIIKQLGLAVLVNIIEKMM